MSKQIHWRSAHDSFMTDDIVPAKSLSDLMRIKTIWTCSDYVHHQHRWRWTAWLCGRWQRMKKQMMEDSNGILKS